MFAPRTCRHVCSSTHHCSATQVDPRRRDPNTQPIPHAAAPVRLSRRAVFRFSRVARRKREEYLEQERVGARAVSFLSALPCRPVRMPMVDSGARTASDASRKKILVPARFGWKISIIDACPKRDRIVNDGICARA